MASSVFLDAVRFLPTLGGTTDWTYSSAVTGYQSPAAAGGVNGAQYSYRAESADLSQWEMGVGTYNTSTGVLSRTTVLFNSAGTNAKISFSAAPQVAVVAFAEDILPLASVSPTTAALGSAVLLNNTASYFDGPSISVGSVGTWFVSGHVTVGDTAGAARIRVRLWDGTTIIGSSEIGTNAAFTATGGHDCIELSGFITSPAGNLKISCMDLTSTSGQIVASQSGDGKDSVISAFRIK